MKKILLVLTLTLLASPAFAVCGDVNESGDVTAADALAVLKYAVGDDVPLTCSGDAPSYSDMRFRHRLLCGGKQFTGTLSASSPGGVFSRSAFSSQYSEYQGLYEGMTPFTRWKMTTPAACNDIAWSGSFAPPAGLKIRADVRVQGSTLILEFFNEGPLGKRARKKQEVLGTLLGVWE